MLSMSSGGDSLSHYGKKMFEMEAVPKLTFSPAGCELWMRFDGGTGSHDRGNGW